MIDRSQGEVQFSLTAAICTMWEPGYDKISRNLGPHFVKLIYNDARPFEVKMIMNDGENIWRFARNIIFEGLEPAGQGGIGDVQMYNDGEEFAYMRLDSPEGWCVIRFRLTEIRGFAREMKILVPQGEEHMDMDLVIAQIFQEEAW